MRASSVQQTFSFVTRTPSSQLGRTSSSDKSPQRSRSPERAKFEGGLSRTLSIDRNGSSDNLVAQTSWLGRTSSSDKPPQRSRSPGRAEFDGLSRTLSIDRNQNWVSDNEQAPSPLNPAGRGWIASNGGKAASAATAEQSVKRKGGDVSLQERFEEEALAKLQEDAEDLEWLRVLDKRMLQQQWYITGLALGGFLLAVVVSEMCGVGDCEWALPVKALISVCTLAQVALMLRQMNLKTEYADTQATLLERSRGMRIDVQHHHQLWKAVKEHWPAVFFVLPYNLIHPVPGLSGTVTIEQLGMQPRYTIESLIAGAMMLRIYHILYLFKLQMITKYLAIDASLIVRNETAIKQLNDPLLSQSKLALKIALERQPGTIILMMWTMLILSATYYIRVFESTEGSSFSIYLWDQMWLAIVTSSTTGYGDLVPQTHLGRLAAVLCMMMGPMLVSIMTAAFSRNMALNARETRLMATLDRDKLEAKVIVTATRIIQSWVRGRLAESRARGAARTASTWQLMSNFGVRPLTANDHEGHKHRSLLLRQLMDTQQILRRREEGDSLFVASKPHKLGGDASPAPEGQVRDKWDRKVLRRMDSMATQLSRLEMRLEKTSAANQKMFESIINHNLAMTHSMASIENSVLRLREQGREMSERPARSSEAAAFQNHGLRDQAPQPPSIKQPPFTALHPPNSAQAAADASDRPADAGVEPAWAAELGSAREGRITKLACPGCVMPSSSGRLRLSPGAEARLSPVGLRLGRERSTTVSQLERVEGVVRDLEKAVGAVASPSGSWAVGGADAGDAGTNPKWIAELGHGLQKASHVVDRLESRAASEKQRNGAKPQAASLATSTRASLEPSACDSGSPGQSSWEEARLVGGGGRQATNGLSQRDVAPSGHRGGTRAASEPLTHQEQHTLTRRRSTILTSREGASNVPVIQRAPRPLRSQVTGNQGAKMEREPELAAQKKLGAFRRWESEDPSHSAARALSIRPSTDHEDISNLRARVVQQSFRAAVAGDSI